MAVDKLVDSTQLDADLTSVANAIRTKGGTSAQMAFPSGFVSAVQAIPTGITPSGTKSITENGTYDVTQYASAEVNVSGGGGGVGTKISEFTISTPVREVSVNLTLADIQAYDFILLYYDFTTSNDWLYFNVDSNEMVDRPQQYDEQATRHYGTRAITKNNASYETNQPTLSIYHPSRNAGGVQNVDISSAHTINFILYGASSTINSGKVVLYGVKYADL